MTESGQEAFFIGYTNNVAPALARFLAIAGLAIVMMAALLGFILSRQISDPGFAVAGVRHIDVAGILEVVPYPILRVPEGGGNKARTYLLAGEGKYGVETQISGKIGQAVTVSGYVLKRGTLDMIVVDDRTGISTPTTGAPIVAAEPVSLGRWRLTGEICDGKCYAGAMSPGNGLAHKACANLCLIGGVPPVFVSTASVGGSEYFLLIDEQSGTSSRRFSDAVGRLVSLEGEILRADNFFIFKSDPTTLRMAAP